MSHGQICFSERLLWEVWKEGWRKTRPVRRPSVRGEAARKVGREPLRSKEKEFQRRVSRHSHWYPKQTIDTHQFEVRWFSVPIYISPTKIRNASEEASLWEFVSIKEQQTFCKKAEKKKLLELCMLFSYSCYNLRSHFDSRGEGACRRVSVFPSTFRDDTVIFLSVSSCTKHSL